MRNNLLVVLSLGVLALTIKAEGTAYGSYRKRDLQDSTGLARSYANQPAPPTNLPLSPDELAINCNALPYPKLAKLCNILTATTVPKNTTTPPTTTSATTKPPVCNVVLQWFPKELQLITNFTTYGGSRVTPDGG